MQRRPLVAHLQLLDCPVVPRARFVYAIDPDIGVDQYAGTAVIGEKASGGQVSECRHHRAGSS